MTGFSWFDALPPAEPGRPPERLSWREWNEREDAKEAAAKARVDEIARRVESSTQVPPARYPLGSTCGTCGLAHECGWVGTAVDSRVCPYAQPT